MSMLLRAVLCLAAALALRAQDPLEIVRKSVERDANNAERLTNYAFLERQETRRYDGGGKLAKAESETSEILILSGRPYARKVAENDKPLSPRDALKEQAKLDKEAAKRQRESASAKNEAAQRRREQRRFLREVPEAFTFRLLGTEQVSGKTTWVIQADPKPGYRPKDSRAKLLQKVRGKLWVAQEDYNWAKAEMQVIDTLSFGFGLLRIAPGGTLHFEQMRMNDEVWVPSLVTVRADARLGYLKKLRAEIDVSYKDYKRFSTDSRLVSSDDQ